MEVPEYTIIVPCFNEKGAIADTIVQLVSDNRSGPKFELIVVDDGSTDGSSEILDQIVTEGQWPELRVLHQHRNLGYGAALKTGLRNARSGMIVITDADGTYPNEKIQEFVQRCQNADMVVGSRTGEGVRYSKLRKIPKIFLKAYASWLVGQPIPDMNSGLRVFRKEIALRYIQILPDGFSFTTTITMAMMRNRYRVVFEPIGYEPRIGKSKIRPIRDTLRFSQLILRTGMYFGPLRVFAPIIFILGLLFAASLFYDLFVIQNLTDKTIIMMLSTMNTAMFALLADMIDKRSTS